MPYSKGKVKKYGNSTKPKVKKVTKDTSGMSLAERRKRKRTMDENKKSMNRR
mgnify:FL=1